MQTSAPGKNPFVTFLAFFLVLAATACSQESGSPEASLDATKPIQKLPDSEQPAVLLVTLDTIRADSLGIETDRIDTPHLEALAGRGVYFNQAYSVTPTTLPSHTSMLTGLYPADHRIRENGRMVDTKLGLLPELLKARGFSTAAFVSGYPLDSQFGLSRGFDHYDDTFSGDAVERTAGQTTDRAAAWLKDKKTPLFMWVHYFDPHDPYEPPEPFMSMFPGEPYLGEIAYMDQEVGRLVAAFEEQFKDRPRKIIVVGDHGEGLGDHGEALHGNLLYQSTMRVPLIVTGTEIEARTSERAVSVRQVFDTVLNFSGEQRPGGLLGEEASPVLAEALKPYLQYGWQPHFMAVLDGIKVIVSGDIEIYDVRVDPEEAINLDGQVEPVPEVWDAVEAYSARALANQEQQQQTLSQEALDKLASLGYVGSSGKPPVRDDAPNPRDMAHIFHDMDTGAGLFIKGEYAASIPVFTRILEADPNNFSAALRLAVAYSVTDNKDQAQDYFDRAKAIDPSSIDLRHYQAMHYMKAGQWNLAQPLFESVIAESPDRIPSLIGLSRVYSGQGEMRKEIDVLEKLVKIKESPGREWTRIGQLKMSLRDTRGAIHAFENARKFQGDIFKYNMELGVLYMADGRFKEAAESLDRVTRWDSTYAVALFKRAQVSVLLNEVDREERVRLAWEHADKTTRPLILAEPMFQGIEYR